MLPFGIGFSEIIVVLLILIIFVGPEGIPQAVRTITKIIRAIRSMIDEIKYSEEFDEVKREILQPLEEARRFNPKQKAEAWVKNEIETPIREFTKEHVDDFQDAMKSGSTNSGSANLGSSEASLSSDLSTVAVDSHVAAPDSSIASPTASPVEQIDSSASQRPIIEENLDEELEEESEEDDLGPVATIDPLDRGLNLSQTLPNESNSKVQDSLMQNSPTDEKLVKELNHD